MKEFLHKKCRIKVDFNGTTIFYTAKDVIEVTENHITFIDKFDKKIIIRISDIISIEEGER